MTSNPSIAAREHSGVGGSLLSNSLVIEYVAVSSLRSNPLSPRKFKAKEERAAEKVLAAQNIDIPLVIDGDAMVLVGELILRGARRLKREYLPVIRLSHLSEVEAQALAVAYIGEPDADEPNEEVVDPLSSDIPVSKLGDLWTLGKHRVVCGDSTDAGTFSALMAGSKPASMVFSDPPFGPTASSREKDVIASLFKARGICRRTSFWSSSSPLSPPCFPI